MKEKYERTQFEIIRFETEDVIMTSGEDLYEGWNTGNPGKGDDNEGWMP